jgi:hypothetical protein
MWSPQVKLFDVPNNDKFGITLTDGTSRDPFVCGNTLRIYNYWLYNVPSRAIDVRFAAGNTATAGFPRYGSYAYEPLPESGDSIVSRKTKIIGCSHPDITYVGKEWIVKNDPSYYQRHVKECNVPGSSVQFTFTGPDIYWRAVADSDGGKADVYIDGKLEETVDCYYRESLPFQFAFIKTGLDRERTHTVRVVIRADKNPKSGGTVIRHMAFEYAAESYNASAGFTNVMGKNNWLYQQWNEDKYGNLEFLYAHRDDIRSGKENSFYPNCWGRKDICLVGNDYQIPGKMDAARTFIAPHAGKIRIEGNIEIEKDTNTTCSAKIVKNDKETLLSTVVSFAKPTRHDLIVEVQKDDAIVFVVKRNAGKNAEKVIWDPTITFLH